MIYLIHELLLASFTNKFSGGYRMDTISTALQQIVTFHNNTMDRDPSHGSHWFKDDA